MPRVPCLDNLTVSREYNGRIFGKRHAKRIRQTNCWSTVDCRCSQTKFFDRRTDMRAPLYPTVYPILYIPREILLDSFRLFERFSITFYYSAISGWSNELSNVYFFETQWNISSRTSLLLAFLFWFEMNYSMLFVISSRHSGIFSGCISLLFAFLFWFETNYSMFHYFSSYILRLFSTFRLFILSSLVKMELFDVYFSRYRKIF